MIKRQSSRSNVRLGWLPIRTTIRPVLGDTDIDLYCARNSGCTGFLIREAAPAEGEFDGLPLASHLPDCAAFARLARAALENRPA